MRVLVDTNVFLDLLLERDNYSEVKLFFSNCVKRLNRIYVTSMSLRDIEYVAHRACGNKIDATRILSRVYCSCSKVIGISADDAITAIYEDYKDYEDGLLIEAAKSNMLDAIITNNKKDFINHGFPIFTPAEINEIWSRD